MPEQKPEQTVSRLMRQLVPLAMSDVIMALGDPLQISTVSRLGNPKASLAAMGVVKALANFLERPIIMILQTSTALSGDRRARHCLARFVCRHSRGVKAASNLRAWGSRGICRMLYALGSLSRRLPLVPSPAPEVAKAI